MDIMESFQRGYIKSSMHLRASTWEQKDNAWIAQQKQSNIIMSSLAWAGHLRYALLGPEPFHILVRFERGLQKIRKYIGVTNLKFFLKAYNKSVWEVTKFTNNKRMMGLLTGFDSLWIHLNILGSINAEGSRYHRGGILSCIVCV